MSLNKLELLSAMTNIGKFNKPQISQNNVAKFLRETFISLFGDPKGENIIIMNIMMMKLESCLKDKKKS